MNEKRIAGLLNPRGQNGRKKDGDRNEGARSPTDMRWPVSRWVVCCVFAEEEEEDEEEGETDRATERQRRERVSEREGQRINRLPTREPKKSKRPGLFWGREPK